MRPGVAADEDSATALIDSLIAVPGQLVDLMQAEQREYGEFLTPVQRAQLMLIHRRFENNIQAVRVDRRPIHRQRIRSSK